MVLRCARRAGRDRAASAPGRAAGVDRFEANQDDKLLLDIKGTMSEAELHWIGLRLHGALQNKARRGALRIGAPTGYVWGGDRFELDPSCRGSALRLESG